ncbi:erythromycin esterase family protein [Burkholderia mayonis]|uniref:erythromycin esterase family protein n=1 Tax=Burkholderia mayonis TaxID=1385591 RepID=UPI003AAA423B
MRGFSRSATRKSSSTRRPATARCSGRARTCGICAIRTCAIGVIYLPETERDSHYFMSSITGQFDALFHLDETSPLEPLAPPDVRHPREKPVPAS